jgi:hypothetical protein
MGYHQFRHVIVLTKLGFQEKDGIQGKRWDSRKIMGFQQKHGIPAKR